MTTHPHTDPLCSCGANSKAERARLYPTPPAISEQMVKNHFEVQATEQTFRAIFDQFVRKEVA